jgi:hypothetical protein
LLRGHGVLGHAGNSLLSPVTSRQADHEQRGKNQELPNGKRGSHR